MSIWQPCFFFHDEKGWDENHIVFTDWVFDSYDTYISTVHSRCHKNTFFPLQFFLIRLVEKIVENLWKISIGERFYWMKWYSKYISSFTWTFLKVGLREAFLRARLEKKRSSNCSCPDSKFLCIRLRLNSYKLMKGTSIT